MEAKTRILPAIPLRNTRSDTEQTRFLEFYVKGLVISPLLNGSVLESDQAKLYVDFSRKSLTC